MPSALAFIGGGLLEGVGKGLVESGKEKRERALADLEHERRLERDDRAFEARRGLLSQSAAGAMKRLGLNIGSRESLAGEASTERRELASEATKSREKIAKITAASREKAARITAGKPTDTTSAEDRIIKRHVTTDENGLETINHEGAATELEARGLKKAAQAQRRKGKAIVDQENRNIAEVQADAEVEEKAGAFSTDATDFKEDGGSRIRFRARRVREIIAEQSGKVTPKTSLEAAGSSPYVGDTPPPSFPDARRAKDGFWYVSDPDRPGKFKRVQRK